VKLVHGWIEGVGTGFGRLYVRDGESVEEALLRWYHVHWTEAKRHQAAWVAIAKCLAELQDNE
jgi:hypothetical protein